MNRPAYSIVVLGVFAACSGEPFAGVVVRDNIAGGGNSGAASDSGAAGRADTRAPFSGGGGVEHPGMFGSGGATGGAKATSGAAPAAGGEATDTNRHRGGSTTPAAAGAAPHGDAGAAGASSAPECPTRSGGDWALEFFPELRDLVTQESHPFFRIVNLGAATASLDRIKIRYYFSKETDVPETAACYWVTGDRCSLAEMHFGDVAKPTASASRYLEVGFPGASQVMVLPGTFEVRVGFKTGSTPMIQSNDYSFDPDASAPSAAAPFPYKRWLQTTLYIDDELVWGTEPCSSSSGP